MRLTVYYCYLFAHALAAPPPAAWRAGIAEGSLFVTEKMPDWRDGDAVLRNGTSVGNGFVGTAVDGDTVYIGGVVYLFV